jgi:hypothetical protein
LGHAALTGRVLDAEGNPVAGVALSLQRQGLTTQTDAQGRFSLGPVSITPVAAEAAIPSPFLSGKPFLAIRSPSGSLWSAQGRFLGGFPAPGAASLAKTGSVEDTLSLSKAAYLPLRKVVDDGNVGDITLYRAFSGNPETYFGFNLYRFKVGGRSGLVVAPKRPKAGNPWIWRTYFWNHKPAFDSTLCAKGYYLAFVDVPNLYGAPQAVAAMDSFYVHVTTQYGFSRKANLLGVSRGAFYAYNWGRNNISKISTIYGDGAGMDLVSWPCGCYGTGAGSAGDWTAAKAVYGFKSDAEGKAYKGNPYQNMKPFADARIPIVHVYGETDLVAPPQENVLAASDSLKAHGWQMLLLAKPNTGHVHGLGPGDGGKPGQQEALVDFVWKNTSY